MGFSTNNKSLSVKNLYGSHLIYIDTEQNKNFRMHQFNDNDYWL
jgi:hypothetical protein